MREFSVGFDLDMTLVDSAESIAESIVATASHFGVEYPLAAAAATVGQPLPTAFAAYLPEQQLSAAVGYFHDHYVEHGVGRTTALAGADQLLRTVAQLGGRSVVVTGKRTETARAALQAAGLTVHEVVGGHYGVAKAAVLQNHGVQAFVGDHIGDMHAAVAAGVIPIGLTSHTDDEQALRAAGATIVCSDLDGVSGWIGDWVLAQRTAALLDNLRSHGSVLVAFSGGIDSALVVAAAVQAVGVERVVAATGVSDSLAVGELSAAQAFLRDQGVEHVPVPTAEMDSPGYRANGRDRCYFCKSELAEKLLALAQRRGIGLVATGTNADDVASPHRPGIKAAAERGLATPLADAGLSKAQVRALARQWGLPNWDRPAKACLASRIEYGLTVTPARLARVDRAEQLVRAALAAAGLQSRNLRVRDRSGTATIEVDAAIVPAASVLSTVPAAAIEAGFDHALVDPVGFRSGALNEVGPARILEA